ncbi:olfactory receptor 1052-like [Alligator sinensis]|uniref:Olfactory receptor n=1 Tax=Alligator sinensis TaxID=38654 RepID=A0A3Q0HEW2_ALLSI|nr:olfactory receptor 1052-like [Alligator sinensis]
MAMGNKTTVSYFVMSGVSSYKQFQPFLFVVFLLLYLLTVMGNGVIMVVIRSDPHLHTPMYFFLFHFSFIDIGYSSVTVPKMLQNFWADKKTISFHACIIQMSLLLLGARAEVFMLSAMAYDRYIAICDPLHYEETKNKQVCIRLVGGTCLISILNAVTNTIPVLHLHFCGPNELNHFSCEFPSLLQLSCTDTFINKMIFLISAMLVCLTPLSIILVSYLCIISTILRIRSAEGQSKAFSTCSSHLTVVVLYYGAGLFRHLRPSSASSVVLVRLFSIQYSILTPMLNPIIYSLRNKEIVFQIMCYIAHNIR